MEIGRAQTLPLNQLAAILNLDKSTASRTVDNLVRHDIARRQMDPENRRCVVISLSECGHDLFMQIEAGMNQYFNEVYDQIPVSKRSQVIESLRMLADAVSKVESQQECEKVIP